MHIKDLIHLKLLEYSTSSFHNRSSASANVKIPDDAEQSAVLALDTLVCSHHLPAPPSPGLAPHTRQLSGISHCLTPTASPAPTSLPGSATQHWPMSAHPQSHHIQTSDNTSGASFPLFLWFLSLYLKHIMHNFNIGNCYFHPSVR